MTLIFKTTSKDRSLRQLLQRTMWVRRPGVEVEHAHARQQISLRQIRMLMPAEGAIHQPVAILNIEGETADEALLFVGRGDEVQAILVFGVKHVAFHVCFEARMVADVNDDAVTQDSHRSIVRLFVAKGRAVAECFGRIRAAVVDRAPATLIQIRGL